MRFVALMVFLVLAPAAARAGDAVTFGLDWRAEAEYGGYYQAVATGVYARHGLDVSIREGGPEVNQTQALLAGRLDFNIASNASLVLNILQQNVPLRAVAAGFQKDPIVLLAHPGTGNDNLASLVGKPIMISASGRAGWWSFLKAKFGYRDSQIRPYTFNLAPFLADRAAIQQGYLGSEPFSIRQEGHFDPVVMLLADAGYAGYASLIVTTDTHIRQQPDLVKRFIDASMEGWYSYLYGDPAPGNALIRKANPEMTDALIAYGIGAIKAHGIVDSGDAAGSGIGAMTAARWKSFYRDSVAEGLYPAGLDVTQAYTLEFVNHRAGMDLKH